jgi:transcriptional regulator with XRE-family HTH domain
MNLGEKLRQLRQDRNLTQPELAEAMGIEQSYLSKLENGKYVPSSDVFSRMLDVFGLRVGDFVDELDHGSRLQLRQIPEVASHFDRQKQLILGNRRKWLLGSAASFALGAALIYGGTAQLFVPGVVYQYRSAGIVLEGEPKELFDHRETPFETRQDIDARNARLAGRFNEDYLSTRYFRGNVFNVPVDGGSRTYYLRDTKGVDSWVNKGAAFIGILLVVLGATGFVLEKKLSRYQ